MENGVANPSLRPIFVLASMTSHDASLVPTFLSSISRGGASHWEKLRIRAGEDSELGKNSLLADESVASRWRLERSEGGKRMGEFVVVQNLERGCHLLWSCSNSMA